MASFSSTKLRWGAERISTHIGFKASDLSSAFGAMDPPFSAPSHIVLLENVVTFDRSKLAARDHLTGQKFINIALKRVSGFKPNHAMSVSCDRTYGSPTDRRYHSKADRPQLP